MSGDLGSISSNLFTYTNSNERLAKQQEPIQNYCLCISGSIALALFIIGAIGAAGLMSGVSVGGCAVGLSIPMALASCCSGAKDENGQSRACTILVDVIYAVVMTVLGSLTISGVLPATTMGWCLIAPTLAYFALKCVLIYCKGLTS